MRCRVLTGARLHSEASQRGGFRVRAAMVTLTYRPGVVWNPRHVTTCVDAVREYARRRGWPLRYLWVAELQERGAVHFHLIFWLPPGAFLPMFDKRGWWPHGSTRVDVLQGSGVGYVAKYASKGERNSRNMPAGCRLFGLGGLTGRSLLEARWWKAAKRIREQCAIEDEPVRVRGGWMLRGTGEFLPAIYKLVKFEHGHLCMMHREVFDAMTLAGENPHAFPFLEAVAHGG